MLSFIQKLLHDGKAVSAGGLRTTNSPYRDDEMHAKPSKLALLSNDEEASRTHASPLVFNVVI